MTIKAVFEEKPGEQVLAGLQMGPYLISSDFPGISFVVKREGNPHDLLVAKKGYVESGCYGFSSERSESIDIWVAPSEHFRYRWSIGPINGIRASILSREDESETYKLLGLSTDISNVLMSMTGTKLDINLHRLKVEISMEHDMGINDSNRSEAYQKFGLLASYQPGLNLNSLAANTSNRVGMGDYAPPEEELITKTLDEIYKQITENIRESKGIAENTEEPMSGLSGLVMKLSGIIFS